MIMHSRFAIGRIATGATRDDLRTMDAKPSKAEATKEAYLHANRAFQTLFGVIGLEVG